MERIQVSLSDFLWASPIATLLGMLSVSYLAYRTLNTIKDEKGSDNKYYFLSVAILSASLIVVVFSLISSIIAIKVVSLLRMTSLDLLFMKLFSISNIFLILFMVGATITILITLGNEIFFRLMVADISVQLTVEIIILGFFVLPVSVILFRIPTEKKYEPKKESAKESKEKSEVKEAKKPKKQSEDIPLETIGTFTTKITSISSDEEKLKKQVRDTHRKEVSGAVPEAEEPEEVYEDVPETEEPEEVYEDVPETEEPEEVYEDVPETEEPEEAYEEDVPEATGSEEVYEDVPETEEPEEAYEEDVPEATKGSEEVKHNNKKSRRKSHRSKSKTKKRHSSFGGKTGMLQEQTSQPIYITE
jgi:hypothetical protein